MDEIARSVIGCLLEDGRATYAKIGAQVGLSASAVKRRIDSLIESGVIRGFTAVIDAAALGWNTEAYVELYCKGTVAPEELRHTLEQIPEVMAACTVSGSADALVHMRASDITHFERGIQRIRNEETVDHTESVIVLSRLIDRRPF